jgi:hypothetical protein
MAASGEFHGASSRQNEKRNLLPQACPVEFRYADALWAIQQGERSTLLLTLCSMRLAIIKE